MTSPDQQPPRADRARRIRGLVERGILDAELAGLVSLLAGTRLPVVVAGPAGGTRDAIVAAVLDLLPPESHLVELAGDAEDFEWLPEAVELGWRHERPLIPATSRDAVVARLPSSTTVIVARDLAGDGPAATNGARARIVVRALALGYGLVAATAADGLEGVLARLAEASIGTDEDERSRLGLVLVTGEPAPGPRVVAAHYVRPLARDTHGHVQRQPPAVLATWNADGDCWDHFAWGVLPELANLAGRRPIDFEREQAQLAAELRSPAAPLEG